jgi:hypothetical protein
MGVSIEVTLSLLGARARLGGLLLEQLGFNPKSKIQNPKSKIQNNPTL